MEASINARVRPMLFLEKTVNIKESRYRNKVKTVLERFELKYNKITADFQFDNSNILI